MNTLGPNMLSALIFPVRALMPHGMVWQALGITAKIKPLVIRLVIPKVVSTGPPLLEFRFKSRNGQSLIEFALTLTLLTIGWSALWTVAKKDHIQTLVTARAVVGTRLALSQRKSPWDQNVIATKISAISKVALNHQSFKYLITVPQKGQGLLRFIFF